MVLLTGKDPQVLSVVRYKRCHTDVPRAEEEEQEHLLLLLFLRLVR